MTTPGGEKLTESSGDTNPISSMIDALKERLRSPFFSAVVIAWVLINWRALLFLCFDDGEVLQKIAYADENYFNVWNLTVLPITSAIVYVIASPWTVWAIGRYRSLAQKRVDKDRLTELKALADTKREIEDPGGLKLELSRLTEDINRQQQYLANLKSEESDLSNRLAKLKLDIKGSEENLRLQKKAVDAARSSLAELKNEMRKLEKPGGQQKIRSHRAAINAADIELANYSATPEGEEIVRRVAAQMRQAGMRFEEIKNILLTRAISPEVAKKTMDELTAGGELAD